MKPFNRVKKKCLVCGGVMLVAPGQVAKYHGKANGNCRKLRHNKGLK